jgi:hypothetical protein
MTYTHRLTAVKMKLLNPEIKNKKHMGVFHCVILESHLPGDVGKKFDVSKDALGRDWVLIAKN